jgi:hypothetical protein
LPKQKQQQKKSAVTLMLRVTDENGKRRYLKPVESKVDGKPPKALMAWLRQQVTYFPDGVYDVFGFGVDVSRY